MTESPELMVLLGTAVSIAFLHTLIGVDHMLPFVMLGRARGWSLSRVLAVTALCGVGHVLSSVVLGFVGIGLGTALEKLEWIEAGRGSLAAWLLIAFGLWLTVRSLWRNFRGRVHTHVHSHADGVTHSHPHDHGAGPHRHAHVAANGSYRSGAVWSLFIVFVFGPCEPLIPLLMAPAALHGWTWVAAVSLVFGAVTVGTMMTLVAAAHVGLGRVSLGVFERHADALAGGAIALSGAAIQFLGI